MLSVPRDLWVKQPVNYFGAYQKINAAYESGKYRHLGKVTASNANADAVQAGFSSIDEVLKTVLNVNINYHVLVNFQAFRQAIDTVGGVTVDVKEPLVDPTMAWENKWNPLLAAAGVQQMNGTKALMYARSRETTSDFARSERQRQILVALKDKVLTAGTLSNPAKIDGLMNAFGDNVYTDLSTQGASRLYTIMKKVDDTKIKSIGLTEPQKLVTTDRVGTASVVRPVAGFENYNAIQAYVLSQIPDGYLLKERAPIAVVGKTQAGADATASLLKSYGYNVVSTSTTAKAVLAPVVVDLSRGKNPYTQHYLEERYGVKVATTLPASITAPTVGTRFVIIEPK
jgi:LCP family protein required for cell wall assembly